MMTASAHLLADQYVFIYHSHKRGAGRAPTCLQAAVRHNPRFTGATTRHQASQSPCPKVVRREFRYPPEPQTTLGGQHAGCWSISRIPHIHDSRIPTLSSIKVSPLLLDL